MSGVSDSVEKDFAKLKDLVGEEEHITDDSVPKVENENDFSKLKDSVGEEDNTDSNPKGIKDSAGEEDNTDSDPEALSPPKPMKELVPTFPCLADLTREEYDDMFPCLADVYPAHEQWADSESSGEDPNTDSDPKVENEKDFAKSKDSVGEEHNTDSNPKATIPKS
ncbi:uncharacterized protein LOC123921637 isoform X3 [Trifolium pratense]|uniref:uncharacterized protein LOC123921637 isoform X3 n=1 Tax=Trifolium pratense TaxID=57577 RepID=UPI001E692EF5|nr:uncharacterized protein LOC123921637 isoform X3 [Trifolium pratense]